MLHIVRLEGEGVGFAWRAANANVPLEVVGLRGVDLIGHIWGAVIVAMGTVWVALEQHNS